MNSSSSPLYPPFPLCVSLCLCGWHGAGSGGNSKESDPSSHWCSWPLLLTFCLYSKNDMPLLTFPNLWCAVLLTSPPVSSTFVSLNNYPYLFQFPLSHPLFFFILSLLSCPPSPFFSKLIALKHSLLLTSTPLCPPQSHITQFPLVLTSFCT